MSFVHHDLGSLSGGEIVEVTLSGTEANVCLMDDSNFRSYRAGQSFRHFGGHYKRSPVRLLRFLAQVIGTWPSTLVVLKVQSHQAPECLAGDESHMCSAGRNASCKQTGGHQ